MLPSGHLQLAVELHLERAAVMAAGQRVGQRLLLNLGEQPGMVHGYRHLIGDSAQQKNFVFAPDPLAVGCRYIQSPNKTPWKINRHTSPGWSPGGVPSSGT